MIVLTVYASKLAILCKGRNAVLVALIFRAFLGSGKLIYSFNIKLMTFYNQKSIAFAKISKLKVGNYLADFKMQYNRNCSRIRYNFQLL